MVEAAASAGDDDMARQALAVCQELWPPDAESLVMIQRANRRGSALTTQTLSLDRDKLDQPLHHERHESALVGTTRTESSLGVAEQPLQSETFFK